MRLSEELRQRTKQYASAIIRGEPLDQLLRETDELLAIFTSMVSKLRKSGI